MKETGRFLDSFCTGISGSIICPGYSPDECCPEMLERERRTFGLVTSKVRCEDEN